MLLTPLFTPARVPAFVLAWSVLGLHLLNQSRLETDPIVEAQTGFTGND